MTAPRIVPAVEARALLEAATPGPWMHNWRGPEDGAPGDLWHTDGCGGPLTREADWELAARAPDLAATVVALHALLDEAYDIIASQGNPAWDDWCDRVCKIDLEVTP